MNILAFHFRFPMVGKVLKNLADARPGSRVYSVHTFPQHHFEDSSVEFINANDLICQRFPDEHEDATLNPDILRALAPYEGQIFRNIDNILWVFARITGYQFPRFRKGLRPSYDEMKQFYFRHVRYWDHFLRHKKIDVVLSCVGPHYGFDLITYYLCKIHNIPFIFLNHSVLSGLCFITHAVDDFCPLLKKAVQGESLAQPNPRADELYQILEKNYYHTATASSPTPKWNEPAHIKKRKYNLKKAWLAYLACDKAFPYWKSKEKKSLLGTIGGLARALSSSAQEILVERKNIQFYHQVARRLDLTAKFIYVPLHYQPELSSCPLGGVFCDFHVMISTLSRHLPQGWKIYVKEHVVHAPLCRSVDYYQQLIEIPQVELASLQMTTYQLIDSCQAVGALTGTAGWEGLCRGKPALVFGEMFYKYFKYALPVRTDEDCRHAMHTLQQEGFKPTEHEMLAFLRQVSQVGFMGWWSGKREPYQGSEEDVTRNTTFAFERELVDL